VSRRRTGMLTALILAASALAALMPAMATAATSPVRHVFIVVLENESASVTFGPSSPAPYLSQTLRSEGAFLPNYFATGHESNDNYISMISGQAPNAQNQADCQTFDDFVPGTIGSYGQVNGTGCVYPASVQTIAGQLGAAGFTWEDYNEDMGADPTREQSVCAHPGLNGVDNTQKATAADEYATRHNPFVYFHSIIDDTTLCDTHVVNLAQLPNALSSAAATPNYAFITPDLCDDGHDAPCASGAPGGLVQVNKFLQILVPQITASPAFRQDGLLLITFDEAATSDASSCCGEIPGPGSPSPGINGPGGGRVGAVVLSPCIAPGTVSNVSYNHYSMLRSVEDMFGLSHLGYAALPGETSLGSDVFNRPCGSEPPKAAIHAPPLLSSTSAKARIPVRWSSTTAGGTPIASYAVRVRDTGARKPRWRTLKTKARATSLQFKATPGHTYAFQVQAVDSGGEASKPVSATTVVPSGVRPAEVDFSSGWTVHKVHGAWLGQAITSNHVGSSLRLRFSGGDLKLIGERNNSGGVARITLDGHNHTVHLHSSRPQTRQVIYSAKLRPRVHHPQVTVVSGTVALEGVAITSRRS
jgi:hypothetical protein